MTLKRFSFRLTLYVVLGAFLLQTLVGCAPTAVVQTSEQKMPVSRARVQQTATLSHAARIDSTTATPAATAPSDEVRAPNRTSLIILALGAVALVIATPIIISRIGGRGGESPEKSDGKEGVSSVAPVPGH